MNIQSIFRRKSVRLCLTLASAGLIATLTYAVFDPDYQPIATLGALELDTYDLSKGGSAIAFRGDYFSPTWDGDLVAHTVNSNGSSAVKWRASERMALQSWSNRKIGSYNGTRGVPFQWSDTPSGNTLSAAQLALLGDSTKGPPVLRYLQGDASNEFTTTNTTGSYRQRFTRLGAVIHSRPFYYKKAGSDLARVYVGSNDGMLHAFDAGTGDEVFAYVPGMVFSKLKALSKPSLTNYPYFVDGLMTISEVKKSGGGTSSMLVSALGGGAKGLFALDVSDPNPATSSDVASMAKWEVTSTSTNYANLGNIYGSPQIVNISAGDPVVLVPNGVNSESGVSSLFVIKASDGTVVKEISAGTGPDNGLGGIAAIDSDGNGTYDLAYAGDLKGTLWKFNLIAGTATALFTPAAGTARPITATPSIVSHPLGGVLVNFGTGKVYESADLTSTATEYLYGIWDGSGATSSVLAYPTLTDATSGGKKYRTGSTDATTLVNYASGHKGWRISLKNGERLLGGDTLTDNGIYTVTTTLPSAGAWLYRLDALTGRTPTTDQFQDVNGSKVIVGGSTPVAEYLDQGLVSQPVLLQLSSTLNKPYFNSKPITTTPILTSTTTTGGLGITGGHFDFDIYYNTCNASSNDYAKSCGENIHKHEYDDTYDVTGVNMLNASVPGLNLVNAIPSTSTAFKILIANTNYSPAARLVVVGPGVSIDEAVWNLPLSPEGFLAATAGGTALRFNRSTLTTFVTKLPFDVFTTKEWRSGSGDSRAGLIPTQTGCVRSNTGGQNGSTGAWMNGALTFQIVKDDTTSAQVEATGPTDAGGYRLKKGSGSLGQGQQLAQYTIFWHHPNNKCVADAGWTKAPPGDTTSDASSETPAAGSADPKGVFLVGQNGEITTGTSGTTTQTYNGVEVTVTLTFNGTGVTQVIKNKATGAVIRTTVIPGGSLDGSALLQATQAARIGRVGWRELVR